MVVSQMKNILIVGGSGFIGSKLEQYFLKKGHHVAILSRTPKQPNHFYWSPEKLAIDTENVKNTEVLINLSGARIDEKNWTTARKKELISSRVETTNALFQLKDTFPNLTHYISASGISAYGFDDGTRIHPETDPFGSDFTSQLVRKWEASADQFEAIVPVTKIRIAIVLDHSAGALAKLIKPIKMYVGAPIGKGSQQIPWVHVSDLVRIFDWVIEQSIYGPVNSNASNNSNKELTVAIAKQLKKPLWMPNVPGFLIRLFFGELSNILLKGAKADNAKLTDQGFEFEFPTLAIALEDLLKKD